MSNSSFRTSFRAIGPGTAFAPTTDEIGFLEADLDVVVTAFCAWFEELGRKPVRRSICGGLADKLCSLLPLTSVSLRRHLFVETEDSWTALFNNGAAGTDAFPVASYLAKRIGCRGVRAVSVRDGPRTYGATILAVYGPEPTPYMNYLRTVCAANDGGRWVFEQSGTPFPFEELEQYSRCRIRDRFNHETLVRYLTALGIEAYDDGFYRDAILVERNDPVPNSVEYFDFHAAQIRFPPRSGSG